MGIEDSRLRDRLVFLVGARRSGTNWLQRILAAHPDVLAVPSETYVLSHGVRPLSDRVQHGALGLTRTGAVFMDRGEFLDASRDFCDRIFSGVSRPGHESARRIVERTPWHAYAVDLIAEVYPDSWTIHIIRDGRDVARSILAQPWGPKSMHEAAAEWRGSVESARDTKPRPSRYREVRYEDLLADPENGLADLIAWLGLDADRATVERMLTEAGVQFNVDPTERGVRTGKWRSLSAEQLAEFEDVAGDLNAELGYADGAGPRAQEEGRRDRPSGTRRALGRLSEARRRAGGGIEKTAFEREALNRLEANQYIFEQVLESLHVDPDRIRGLLGDRASVRIVGRESDWSGRGPEAAERLIEWLRDDPARAGRQVRGDVHSGLPTFTAVLAYEMPDGSRAERILVARIRAERVIDIYVNSNSAA